MRGEEKSWGFALHRLWCLGVLVLGFFQNGWAGAIPNKVTLDEIYVNKDGTLPNLATTKNLRVSLYKTGDASSLWEKDFDKVMLQSGGEFLLVLEKSNALAALPDFSEPIWYEIIDRDDTHKAVALKPFTSVPYAAYANHATETDHATAADHATKATEADHATAADHATKATEADHATATDHATKATEADHAAAADHATKATEADHAAAADHAKDGVPQGAMIVWILTAKSPTIPPAVLDEYEVVMDFPGCFPRLGSVIEPYGIGGSETHSHSFSTQSGNCNNTKEVVTAFAGGLNGYTDDVAAKNHSHGVSGTTADASNIPPYVNIVFLRKK